MTVAVLGCAFKNTGYWDCPTSNSSLSSDSSSCNLASSAMTVAVQATHFFRCGIEFEPEHTAAGVSVIPASGGLAHAKKGVSELIGACTFACFAFGSRNERLFALLRKSLRS